MILNQNGAIVYNSIGELNPTVIIENSLMEKNGIAILNLTAPPSVDLTLYNTKKFSFSTNYLGESHGGLNLAADTFSIATALRGNITNNIFVKNKNGEVLKIGRHHFQRVTVRDNVFLKNKAGNESSNINIDNVAVDFIFNVVENNTGHTNLLTSSKELTDTVQVFTKNSFRENNSTSPSKSTIRVRTGKPAFVHNYIVNELNNFEVEANKKSNHTSSNIAINATQNWWGAVHVSFINGRIWDSSDDSSLTAIDFSDFKTTNSSVMEGKCLPGWTLDSDRCYRYMGGALSYHRAETFCREQEGFLAEVKGREKFMKYLLQLSQNVYKPEQRVWVYASVSLDRCSAFHEAYVVEEQDCNRLLYPFVCEKDPYILPPSSNVYMVAIAVCSAVFGVAILVIAIIAIMAYVKARKRKEHRKEMLASVESLTLLSSRRGRSSFGGSQASLSSRRLAGSREYLGSSREMLSSRADSIDNLRRYHASLGDSTESLASKRVLTSKINLANSYDKLSSSREMLRSNDTPRSRTGLYDRRKFPSNETLESRPRPVFHDDNEHSNDDSDESFHKGNYPPGQSTQTRNISEGSDDSSSIEKKPIPDSPSIHSSVDNLSLSSFQKPQPFYPPHHRNNNLDENDSPGLNPALRPKPRPKPKPKPKPLAANYNHNNDRDNENRRTVEESQLPLLYNRNRQSGGGVVLAAPTRNETEI